MNWFKSVLKTLGPRVIGAAVAGLSSYIYDKTKGAVQMDPETTTQLVTGMLIVYAGAHRAASAVINPGDAAKGRVADAVKEASDSPFIDTVKIPPSK